MPHQLTVGGSTTTTSDVTPIDCDVTLRTEPSDRTTSGYLRTWVITEPNSTRILEAVLWEDGDAEYSSLIAVATSPARV